MTAPKALVYELTMAWRTRENENLLGGADHIQREGRSR